MLGPRGDNPIRWFRHVGDLNRRIGFIVEGKWLGLEIWTFDVGFVFSLFWRWFCFLECLAMITGGRGGHFPYELVFVYDTKGISA